MKPQLCFGEKKCSLFVIFCFAELASNHNYFFAKKYAVISASKIPLSLRFDKWVWASCFLTTDTWCALLLPVFQTQHLLHVLPVVLKTANNKNVYVTFLMNNQMDWELTKHKEMSCTAAKANKPTHFVCLLLRRLVTAFFDWKTADVSSVHSVSICVKPSPLGKSAPTLFSPKIEEIFYVCNNRTFSNLPRYFRRLQAAFNTEASDIPIVSRFT